MDRISEADFNWLALALAGEVERTRDSVQHWLSESARYYFANWKNQTNPRHEPLAETRLRELLSRPKISAEAYVHALLACGADPRIPNKDGATALMLAVERGDIDVIHLLLPLSEPKAQHARTKLTALFEAVVAGDAEVVALLLPHSDANARDNSGRNALMQTYQNRAKMTELLLPATDPLATDNEGLTALAWAARMSDAASIRMLLPVSDRSTMDNAGQTPLIWAVRAVAPECVALLIPHCDLNAKTQTPLETFTGSPNNAKGPKLTEWRDAFGLAALTKAWSCADLLAPMVEVSRVQAAVAGAPKGHMPVSRALIERHELAQAIAPFSLGRSDLTTGNATGGLADDFCSTAPGHAADKKTPHRL